MEKVDLKKSLDSYRARQGEFRLVTLPERQYLMIDGHGDPNTDLRYAEALEALYPVAYKLKFASKRELGRDYVVPPLEGLWWAEDMGAFTAGRDKSRWRWTMMLLVPEWIDRALFERVVEIVRGTGGPKAQPNAAPARLDEVRLEALTEGLSVQTLHIGSFDDEGPVLERMHDEFIPEHGLRMTGRHHEVYFGDFRRTAPEKLRTLLRQPVERGAE